MTDHAPTAPHRDLLAAIRDALNIPLAHHTQIPAEDALRRRRADAVDTAVRLALGHGDDIDGIAAEAEYLRRRIDQLPVTYRLHISKAPDNPAECVVCGPEPCCSPVLGIHGAEPGRYVGREAVSVR